MPPDAAARCLRAPLRSHFDAMPAAWAQVAGDFGASEACESLCRFVDGRVAAGAIVYPERPLAALEATAPAEARVVILGQDPYHGPGQAHGLAFSVPEGTRAPPSLRNILAEVARDCACSSAAAVNLQRWARQGVLLLNAVLTVEKDRPASHARQGWEPFTSAIVAALARDPAPRAFLLWGLQAQALAAIIESNRSGGRSGILILRANHPSPLSARRAPVPFIGCAHFSQANAFLSAHGRAPVDWCG